MNRAQVRRQRWLERFQPKPGDDGLVCHANSIGRMILVEPEKVRAAHADRMNLFDQMKPEYRALLNYFPRLPAGLTQELVQWSRLGVPIDAVRRTLRERYGSALVDLETLHPLNPDRHPPPGEPRKRRTAAEIAASAPVAPVSPPCSGEAMSRADAVIEWAKDAVRDICGAKF